LPSLVEIHAALRDVGFVPTADNPRLQRSINSQNFLRSIFPPEMMATIGPSPAFPVNAAASDNAPAPSETMRAFSASKRIALRVSSRLTTMAPSASIFIRSHIRGKTALTPAPSTNDAVQPAKDCGLCAAKERENGAAVAGSAPQIFISGLCALIALPTP